MDENKSNRDLFDRGRLLIDAFHEVEHFARENVVSPSQVGKLIKRTASTV
ncbi:MULTISPECIES: hypothetical protein [unclassified Mesorhizobium]